MPMPLEEKRRSDIRIWIVSCLFLLLIVAGGVFLALYMALPESKETAWYPIAGMGMVAIPWLFWLLTFMYRCCIKGDGDANFPQNYPASGKSRAASTRESPNDTYPVGPEDQEQQSQQNGERAKEGDSHLSNESELPLALSMSTG